MTTAEQSPASGVSSADVLGLPREQRSRPEGPRVCSECGSAAKYTCPGCQAQTCSLPCAKGHKETTGCTGKRNRAAYVPLDEYSERHLASDFRLLEEAGRASQLAARSRPMRPRHFQELPPHLKSLISHARSRGVTLEIQQPGMARRAANTSCSQGGQQRQIAWRVEWQFPQADVTVFDRRVPETQPLRPLLDAHLAPALRGGLTAGHVLRRYAQAGADDLVVLMRRPHTPANAPQYWRIDTSQPLCSQLQGRTVIEFPTLLVLTQEDFAGGSYPLVPEQCSGQPPSVPSADADCPAAAGAGLASAAAPAEQQHGSGGAASISAAPKSGAAAATPAVAAEHNTGGVDLDRLPVADGLQLPLQQAHATPAMAAAADDDAAAADDQG